MIELIALAVFAALIWFFLKNKKQAHGTRPKNLPESVKPIQQETKPADKIAAPAEPVAPKASESKPSVVKQTNKVVSSTPENSLLPQDSMLKRHYLTNLRAIIDSLSPFRPTDSALLRHYNTQLTANIEQCLNNKAAMEKLICHYENHKKTPAPTAKAPQIVIEESSLNTETASENVVLAVQDNTSKIPKDSMLRRHYITHLHSQIAAKMPARPTDSTLRRHYNAMLESEVNNQLSSQ
jgi:hypothetical protein